MKKVCVEYKLHKNSEGNLKAPDWVENGGHFKNYDDNTLIAFIPDEADREWWIPDGLTTYDEQGFVDRGMAIHADSSFMKQQVIPEEGEDLEHVAMTDAEAEASLRSFYQAQMA
jgi:hypothetical protein